MVNSYIPADIQDMPVQEEIPGNDLLELSLMSLDLKDRPLIDSILHPAATMLSPYSFTAHYIWRDIFQFYWGIIDDLLCLFAQYGDYLYMPIPPVPCHSFSLENGRLKSPLPWVGEALASPQREEGGEMLVLSPCGRGLRGGDFQKIISIAFSIMEKSNKNKVASRIENIGETQLESFMSLGYTIRPGEGEYLYLREELIHLKGDRYKSKRALCNYFVKHYPYSYEPFQTVDAGECIRLFDEWRKKREVRIKDPFYSALLEDSSFAHKQALGHYQELSLTGRVVRINDRIEAYIVGFAAGDIFYILLEVANPDIKGLAQFIFREFCREMAGYSYINTLGDSGLENLRKTKLSYRPYRIVPTYIAYLSG